MPTRTRKKPSGLTLGVIGSGEVSAESVDALLSDYIDSEGDGEARFIIPATADLFSKGVQTVVAYAEENDLPIEILTDDSTKGKKFARVKEQARKEHRAADPVAALVKELAKGNGDARLIVLWDDEDEHIEDAVERADEHDITALDLTTGLDEIELTEEGEEGEEEAEEDEEPFETEDDDDEEPTAAVAEIDLTVAEFAEMKAFAKEHGIDVPPRSKKPTYVREISKWLAERAEAPETSDEDGDDPNLPEVATSRETVAQRLSDGTMVVNNAINVNIHFELDLEDLDDEKAEQVLTLIGRLKAL